MVNHYYFVTHIEANLCLCNIFTLSCLNSPDPSLKKETRVLAIVELTIRSQVEDLCKQLQTDSLFYNVIFNMLAPGQIFIQRTV